MKVSTEIDNNFGYEKITQLVDNIPLNGCSFQIAGVENLKYLDMTGWYCNAEMSDFSYFTLCLNYLFGYHAFRSQKNRFSHYYVILKYLFSPVIRYSEISVFTCNTLF